MHFLTTDQSFKEGPSPRNDASDLYKLKIIKEYLVAFYGYHSSELGKSAMIHDAQQMTCSKESHIKQEIPRGSTKKHILQSFSQMEDMFE